MTGPGDLDRLYGHRFSDQEARRKHAVWAEIAAFLARWIPSESRVLDIACDQGYFIRHVRASERWATDIRDVRAYLGEGVHFVRVDSLRLNSAVPERYFDVVFMSNFLEHLPGAEAVIAQLQQARRALKPRGRVIILQPNIRFVGGAYWDFLDHRMPLTERSLAEAARLSGFTVETLIPRFLPYTTKGRLPSHPLLVRAYLRAPLVWRLLGRQTLLIARSESQ